MQTRPTRRPTRCRGLAPAALTALVLLAAATGCGPDLDQMKKDARAALGSGDHAAAIATSDQGLAKARQKGADARVIWGFESLRVEALARSGEGGRVKAELERLAGEHAAQVDASLYLTLATYVREAGDAEGAVDVLDAGNKRFPEQEDQFAAAIGEIMAASGDDDAMVEKLKSLGYL